jgi:hypothetical protein
MDGKDRAEYLIRRDPRGHAAAAADRELSYSGPKTICFVMPVILLQTAILGSFSVSILGAKFVLQNAFPTPVKAS